MPVDLERWLKLVLLFGPALGLACLGVYLALRSGDARFGSEVGTRSLASNASQIVVRLSLWAVGLALVGEAVGLRTVLQAN